tara:strand:- start:2215 stop:2661 length:447 start_codon:yes stop_codon:yes gene_type:complete
MFGIERAEKRVNIRGQGASRRFCIRFVRRETFQEAGPAAEGVEGFLDRVILGTFKPFIHFLAKLRFVPGKEWKDKGPVAKLCGRRDDFELVTNKEELEELANGAPECPNGICGRHPEIVIPGNKEYVAIPVSLASGAPGLFLAVGASS